MPVWGAKKKSNNTTEDGKKGKKDDVYYWFGYKLHLIIDALYELPMGFILTPANESDMTQKKPLLEKIGADQENTRPQAMTARKTTPLFTLNARRRPSFLSESSKTPNQPISVTPKEPRCVAAVLR
jgi:hypothetical protein